MTDGILLREMLRDPDLSRYSVVMIDEAHERGLLTDVCVGVLKGIRRRRPDLRVIIASATIDAQRFLDFFDMNRDATLRARLEARTRGEGGMDSDSEVESAGGAPTPPYTDALTPEKVYAEPEGDEPPVTVPKAPAVYDDPDDDGPPVIVPKAAASMMAARSESLPAAPTADVGHIVVHPPSDADRARTRASDTSDRWRPTDTISAGASEPRRGRARSRERTHARTHSPKDSYEAYRDHSRRKRRSSASRASRSASRSSSSDRHRHKSQRDCEHRKSSRSDRHRAHSRRDHVSSHHHRSSQRSPERRSSHSRLRGSSRSPSHSSARSSSPRSPASAHNNRATTLDGTNAQRAMDDVHGVAARHAKAQFSSEIVAPAPAHSQVVRDIHQSVTTSNSPTRPRRSRWGPAPPQLPAPALPATKPEAAPAHSPNSHRAGACPPSSMPLLDMGSSIAVAVPGRMFPVEVHYCDAPVSNFILAAAQTVLDIHTSLPPGDVLVFLPGAEEVEQCCEAIRDQLFDALGVEDAASIPEDRRMEICPLYAALPWDAQLAALEPAKLSRRGVAARKIVVATNIAETSLTIDGIVYVVDSGYVKMNVYHPPTAVEVLLTQPISKASASQRAGRAGRVRRGHVFRLYTEDAFQQFADTTPPEIQRCDLTQAILHMLAIGIRSIAHFDYIDPPPAAAVMRGLEMLHALGAVDAAGKLTRPVGAALAELPLEPRLAAAVIASLKLGCAEKMLSIAAMLQSKNLFVGWRSGASKTAITAADASMRQFAVREGDALTLLNIYSAYETNGRNAAWCRENGLNPSAMQRAAEVRGQLRRVVSGLVERFRAHESSVEVEMKKRMGLRIIEDGEGGERDEAAEASQDEARSPAWTLDTSPDDDDSGELVRRALCAGYFAQAARLSADGRYTTIAQGHVADLHSFSVLSRYGVPPPEWIVFCDAVWSSGLHLRNVTAVSPKWLLEAAPHYFKQSGGWSSAAQGKELQAVAATAPAASAIPRLQYRSAAARRAEAEAAKRAMMAAATTPAAPVAPSVTSQPSSTGARGASAGVASMLGLLFGDAAGEQSETTPMAVRAGSVGVPTTGTRIATSGGGTGVSSMPGGTLGGDRRAMVGPVAPPPTPQQAAEAAAEARRAAERARQAALDDLFGF